MADVDQSVRHAKLRNLALEWCGSADRSIWDSMGEGVSGYDRSIFYLTACAEMGAKVYDALMKDEKLVERAEMPEAATLSPEQRRLIAKTAAETLLQSVFALMSGLIRKRGYDVQVSAKLSFTKVDNSRSKEEAEEQECDHGGCRCALDQDGRCAECAALARGFFMALLESVRAMSKVDKSKQMCRSCAKLCMDQVLAKIVRDEFSGMNPVMSDNFMNALLLASQNIATMELPLTKRAWSEVQRGGKA